MTQRIGITTVFVARTIRNTTAELFSADFVGVRSDIDIFEQQLRERREEAHRPKREMAEAIDICIDDHINPRALVYDLQAERALRPDYSPDS